MSKITIFYSDSHLSVEKIHITLQTLAKGTRKGKINIFSGVLPECLNNVNTKKFEIQSAKKLNILIESSD